MDNSSRRHVIFALNILTFILTLHTALPVYINSSYIATFVGENIVGFIYTLCSIMSIIAFIGINPLLRRIGNYRTVMILLTVEIITLICVALSSNALQLISAFTLNFVSITLLGFSTDIFLETFSVDAATGKTRGMYLTSSNAAWVVASIITSIMLSDSQYYRIYGTAALLFIPILFLFWLNFKDFKDKQYKPLSYRVNVRRAFANNNIRSILIVSFLLQFFYAWMTIYMPIYLHNHVGFDWKTISIIFSIMLLPFIFFELPLGKIADTRFGEKEILCLGFLITGIATAFISFIDSKSIILWTAVLFSTRVGASMIEIMNETYFFKQIGPEDSGLISIFRTARPWAYVIAPLFASLFLYAADIKYLFAALGLVLLLGLGSSLTLEDTL